MTINIVFVIIVSFLLFALFVMFTYKKPLNLQKWTFVMLLYFYIVIFFIVFITTLTGLASYNNSKYIMDFNESSYLIYGLAVSLMFAGFSFAFSINKNNKKLLKSDYVLFMNNTNSFYKKLFFHSCVMLLISTITYFLYTLDYGGPIKLLDYTMTIRYGVQENSSRFSIFQKFGSISYISSFMLFVVYRNKNLSNELRRSAMFVWLLSIVISFYIAFSQGGRGTVANIVLVYVFYFALKDSLSLSNILKKHWYKFLVVIAAFLVVNSFFNRSNNIDNVASFVAKGYSYLFSSFLISSNNSNYLFFQELLVFPLFFLPQRVFLGAGIKTTNMINTLLTQGGYKGDIVRGSRIIGESTTGFLSFSFYQLGFIGVLIYSFVVGLVIKYLNKRIELMPKTPYRTMLYSYYLVQVVYYFIGSGTIYNFIITNFGYFLFFISFLVYASTEKQDSVFYHKRSFL